jgi:hypothetical protein
MLIKGICTSEPRPPAPGARFLCATWLKVSFPRSVSYHVERRNEWAPPLQAACLARRLDISANGKRLGSF